MKKKRMKGYIVEINSKTAISFLLPRHYSGRVPTISKAFGWYKSHELTEDNLMAVCTFGKPASPYLCKGVCGDKWYKNVFELNRLCRVDEWKEQLSCFVCACLRRLRAMNWIIVSYSDTAMNHHGYIYQACNFLYTGCTKPRTDIYTPEGKHSRHYDKCETSGYRKVRSAKHRYIYFCTKDKKLKSEWTDCLRYPILPYPKGDNSEDYVLGTYLQDKLIKIDNIK